MPTFEQVRADAAQLSSDDREILMLELAASLEPQTEEEQAAYDRYWDEEIARRIKEMDEGRVEMIPWEDVRAGMMAHLDELKKAQR